MTGICAAQTNPATIYQTPLQRDEQNFGTRPAEQLIQDSACGRDVLGEENLKPVPGFSGLYVIAAGGHTPGSTLFVTRWNDQIWLFSGDITNDMRSIHENLPKHWAYTTFVVPENLSRQAQLRQWLGALDERDGISVLAAHDIAAFQTSSIPAW